MKHKFLLLLWMLCWGMGGFLQAQDSDSLTKRDMRRIRNQQKEKYFILGIGATYNRILDKQMSGNNYYGAGGTFWWGRQVTTPKLMKSFHFFKGNVAGLFPPSLQSQVIMGMIESDVAYTYTLNTSKESPWTLRVGGFASLFGNLRFNTALGNSALNYDIMLSVGPAFQAERKFTIPLLELPALLDYRFRVPLLAYLNRLPDYSLPYFGSPKGFFMPFGRQGRVVSDLGLILPLRSGNLNRVRFAYTWDFYGYRESEIFVTRVASHALTIALQVKL